MEYLVYIGCLSKELLNSYKITKNTYNTASGIISFNCSTNLFGFRVFVIPSIHSVVSMASSNII